ncbi:addiction module antidote protein [Sphingosinicella terrae]|uniref:addiction module antidote protein n=1 Tax=Sphingosinicella terrae TaxID=2172047 RepID=UPI0013B3EC36|nr:addiction module antidote protein [Sphingosinicella terrae]
MIDLFTPCGELVALPKPARDVVLALRVWAVLIREKRCPHHAVAAHLGSLQAAAHLQLMLEEIGAAWPDRFTVSPLCCRHLSHDEATLTEMMRLAARQDRCRFDRLLGEMIGPEQREMLFLSASVLGRMMDAARA